MGKTRTTSYSISFALTAGALFVFRRRDAAGPPTGIYRAPGVRDTEVRSRRISFFAAQFRAYVIR